MNYIEKIVELIIRPSRDHYHTKRLGDPQILIETENGQLIKAHREDRIILNKHNQHLHLSFYQIQSVQKALHNFNNDSYHSFSKGFRSPELGHFRNNSQHFGWNFQSGLSQNKPRQNKTANFKNKCVIYLHANNGSRMEGMTYLTKLLEAHCNVCLFDCSGSGVSQGNYVTLGLKQARDLDSVVNFLIKEKKIEHVALWGRSMGSATALVYGSRHAHGKISSIVLDSPFKDLQKLIKQIASEKTGLPKIFFQPLLPFVRNQILRKTGYNIGQLKLKKYLRGSDEDKNAHSQNSIATGENIKNYQLSEMRPLQKVPAMFIVSKRDKFVKYHHGEKLHKRYPCADKHLQYIDIQHHQGREEHTIDKIIDFIVVKFNQKDQNQQMQMQKDSFHEFKSFSQRPTFNNQQVKFVQDSRVPISREGMKYEASLYSPQITLKKQQISLRNSFQTTFQPYRGLLSSVSINSHFQPKINEKNEPYQSFQSSNQGFAYGGNQNISKSFYNNVKLSFNNSDNSHPQPNYSSHPLPKLNSEYFQVSTFYSPYPGTQKKQANNYYNKKIDSPDQRVLSHQNSHSSLTTKGRQQETSKFITESSKHFSLDKIFYQQGKLGEDLKLGDSKYTQSSFSPKLVSKKFRTENGKEKISLSSTLAFQQNLKNSTVQKNIMSSNLYRSHNYPVGLKADPYKSDNHCLPKYSNSNNFPSQNNRLFAQNIRQNPIVNNFLVQSSDIRFKDTGQLKKHNWNTTSQKNIGLNTEKLVFGKHQKTGPLYYTSSFIKKQDSVHLSLIETREKGNFWKGREHTDIQSLSSRKVESTFTSMIFSDPK